MCRSLPSSCASTCQCRRVATWPTRAVRCCPLLQGVATVPSLLGEEKATNPFLRPNDPAIRAALGVGAEAADAVAFGAIRAAKDRF